MKIQTYRLAALLATALLLVSCSEKGGGQNEAETGVSREPASSEQVAGEFALAGGWSDGRTAAFFSADGNFYSLTYDVEEQEYSKLEGRYERTTLKVYGPEPDGSFQDGTWGVEGFTVDETDTVLLDATVYKTIAKGSEEEVFFVHFPAEHKIVPAFDCYSDGYLSMESDGEKKAKTKQTKQKIYEGSNIVPIEGLEREDVSTGMVTEVVRLICYSAEVDGFEKGVLDLMHDGRGDIFESEHAVDTEADGKKKPFDLAVKIHALTEIYEMQEALAEQDDTLGRMLTTVLRKVDEIDAMKPEDEDKVRAEGMNKVLAQLHPSATRLYLGVKHGGDYYVLTIYHKDGKYAGSVTAVRSLVFEAGKTFYLLDPVGSGYPKELRTYYFQEPRLAEIFKKYDPHKGVEQKPVEPVLPTIR